MEHASGISLHEKWPSMDIGDRIRCIESVFRKLKELVDLEFPAYGSLYFANTPYIASQKMRLHQKFSIGPHCGAMYWGCRAGKSSHFHNVRPNQGPWSDLPAYCDGLIDTGIAKLPPGPIPQRPRYRGSVQTHRRLLEQGRAVLKKMTLDSRVQSAAVPVIFHPDLHTRDIFVCEEDPTVVSAMIDWQLSSIEPAFWYVDEVPDFTQPVPDPTKEDCTEPRSEACAKAFDTCIQFLTPKLATARSMDEAWFLPFRYCYRTWEDGAAAFHEELIQISLRWEELGLRKPYPFPLPRPDELPRHQHYYKRFEAAQQLRHALPGLLNTASDGWVPSEHCEATRLAHREVFTGILQEVIGNEQPDDDDPIKSEDDLREIWPYDLPV